VELAAWRWWVAGVLLGAVAVLGLALAVHPTGLAFADRWGFSVIHFSTTPSRLTRVVDIGTSPAAPAIWLALCALALVRDRRLAVVCVVGFPFVLGCMELGKHAVGRGIGPGFSFPSGHVTATAGLATLAVLVVPWPWRALAIGLGAAACLAVSASVVMLGWHLPTDALAGVMLGVGGVLLVDAASFLIPRWKPSTARSGPVRRRAGPRGG
jgi:membrane-associated phospholipid phosphatase